VKCNTVNRGYNRGTTIHGVHYLEVSGNVYFETMGHTIFVEDAAETKNLIENNLIINTRPSHSLLDTDTTPACIWITHPDNILRGNHCAGSEKYGFWYDL
jgi:cell migration-inducing and hyaluronan-binding protein